MDALVVGSCNLEICVKDAELATMLLQQYPQVRKLYPSVVRQPDGYLVSPRDGYPVELEIPDEKVVKTLAGGGAANAAKTLAKLGAKPTLLTSIGSPDDPAHPVMVKSLQEDPAVDFIDLPGRPNVGLTLSIFGEGTQSTLLLGLTPWQMPEIKERVKKVLMNFAMLPPILAIANSRPYLPMLEGVLRIAGIIDYFCPSRDHVNGLKESNNSLLFDDRFFSETQIIQANTAEWFDIFHWIFGDKKPRAKNAADVLKILSDRRLRSQNKIATDSERGGHFYGFFNLGERVKSYTAYPLPGSFVDDTGCGDIFAGAFFWSYFLMGKGFEKSIEFAAAAATFKIPSMGATGYLPTKEEVEDWVKRHGPKIR